MKHSEEDRLRALEVYKETKSVTGTIRLLGLDMSRGGFYGWLKKAGVPVKKAKAFPSLETKLNAVYRCFKLVDERTISGQRDRLLRPQHIPLGGEVP